MYSKIDIHVTDDEHGLWTVRTHSYEDVNDPNCQPEIGDSEDYDSEEIAVSNAESLAEMLVADRDADSVTIFVDGNEHKTLSFF